MTSFINRFSLRFKITLFIFLLSSTVLFSITYLHLRALQKQKVEDENSLVSTNLVSLGNAAELALVVKDSVELARLAKVFLWDENIAFISIFDEHGKLLAFEAQNLVVWKKMYLGQRVRNYNVYSQLVYTQGDPFLIGIEFPIERELGERARNKKSIGKVVAAYSTLPMETLIRDKAIIYSLLAFLGVFISTVITSFVINHWTSRLQSLLTATQQLTFGDFGAYIDLSYEDEIGKLALSFDKMRKVLKAREKEVEHYTQQLRLHSEELEKAIIIAGDAQDSAEIANKIKSQFLANMSHETRTPLNGILGMAQIMMKEDVSAVQKEKLKVILTEGDRLIKILDEILFLAGGEERKIHLHEEKISFHEMCGAIVGFFEDRAKKKHLQFTYEMGEDVPKIVYGDIKKVRQIVTNILDNAFKFTTKGSVKFKVEKHQKENVITGTKNCSILFTIEDTGMGVPKDKRESIFAKFSQIDESDIREFGGTGLGLAIVQELVEIMKGNIELVSTEGKGTVFKVIIPFRLSEKLQEKQEKQEKLLMDKKVAIDISESPSILVVEDSEVNKMIVTSMLKGLNYKADVVSNGKEALEAMENKKYHLILMDLQMPVMDGFTATKEIRKRERESHEQPCVIVALTANVLEKTQETCLKIGMDDFICKPINLKILTEVLEKHLTR